MVQPSDALAVAAVLVSAAAVIVSIATFYFGHTRLNISEQIRISRDIGDRIRTQHRIVHDWHFKNAATLSGRESQIEIRRALDSLVSELRYFVFFVEKGEIKEPRILEYYGEQISGVDTTIKRLVKDHANLNEYPPTKEITNLIIKYNSLAGKIKLQRLKAFLVYLKYQLVDLQRSSKAS